jgi:hypothetical protein
MNPGGKRHRVKDIPSKWIVVADMPRDFVGESLLGPDSLRKESISCHSERSEESLRSVQPNRKRDSSLRSE